MTSVKKPDNANKPAHVDLPYKQISDLINEAIKEALQPDRQFEMPDSNDELNYPAPFSHRQKSSKKPIPNATETPTDSVITTNCVLTELINKQLHASSPSSTIGAFSSNAATLTNASITLNDTDQVFYYNFIMILFFLLDFLLMIWFRAQE